MRRPANGLPMLSGPGLVIYAITITFAAIDWVMSLEPFWVSTMYPPLYAIGQVTTGFAFATVAAVLLSRVSAARWPRHAQAPARPGRPAADLRHVLGVHGVLAVPADLGRELAG